MATDYVTVVVESVPSVVVESVPSTQDVAAAEYQRTGESVLVVAGAQTQGRGRLGRTWRQAPRALFSPCALTSTWPADRRPLITLVAGLSVRRSIRELTGVAVGLRWPNDLVVPDGKIGGILTETSGDRIVVGCGLNLWWPEPAEGGAGLLDADPGPGLAEPLARAWAENLTERLESPPEQWGRDEYREACVTLGQRVSYRSGSGLATDVTDGGALLVEAPDGPITIASGEVRIGAATTLPADRDQEHR
jgi:BirA family biotin operon repressor/biotin-[acetyl-CoA-carboxylase] ligase